MNNNLKELIELISEEEWIIPNDFLFQMLFL